MYINKAIWECYFPEDVKEIQLSYDVAHFLFRMLSGELVDRRLTDWVNNEALSTFAGNLKNFQLTLTIIDEWIDEGRDQSLDKEAILYIKGFTKVIRDRLEHFSFADQRNSEIYRELHVSKNKIAA